MPHAGRSAFRCTRSIPSPEVAPKRAGSGSKSVSNLGAKRMALAYGILRIMVCNCSGDLTHQRHEFLHGGSRCGTYSRKRSILLIASRRTGQTLLCELFSLSPHRLQKVSDAYKVQIVFLPVKPAAGEGPGGNHEGFAGCAVGEGHAPSFCVITLIIS
jgi:hypothetical protein